MIASVQGGERRANVGGQLAVDTEGKVVGKGDMRVQIEQASKNVQVCLEAAGAKASDIVLTRAYVTDADAFKKNADVFARYLGPASTVTPVSSFSAGPIFLSRSRRWQPSIEPLRVYTRADAAPFTLETRGIGWSATATCNLTHLRMRSRVSLIAEAACEQPALGERWLSALSRH